MLYIVIKEWSTHYLVIDTSTVVKLDFRLVDARSGIELWHQEREVVDSSSRGQGDAFSGLIAAAVYAVMTATTDIERETAIYANNVLINDPAHGMLCGRYHPEFAKDQERRRAKRGGGTGN